MKILFEDNKNSAVSLLLKSCYCGDIICFSGGANLIVREVEKLLCIDNFVLVFIDVPVNNEIAVL